MRTSSIATFVMAAGLTLLFGLPASARATKPAAPAKPAPVNSCVSCHTEAGGEIAIPIAKVQNDVHGKRGLSCVNCHGGNAEAMDMEKAMDPAKGFIGKPTAKQIPSFCGKCHSNADTMKRFNPSLRVDQEAEYATSVHGKKVASGDQKAATCISCHSNHGILNVKDPNSPVYPTRVAETCGGCHAKAEYMKEYKIPTNQLANYKKSVHAETLLVKKDLSAPTCNDCHGNHGAAPPGTASVANVCGSCHVRQAELFGKSPHQPAFEALSIPGCVACHGIHEIAHPTDDLIGTSKTAVCVTCHSEGEPGHKAAGVMHQQLIDLRGRIDGAQEILDRAARAGMEVSKPRFELNDAKDSLVNARVVIHGVSMDEVGKVTGAGAAIAEKSHKSGVAALAELLFRRKGLAVSLLLIALATLSIYLKLRQIERAT